MNKINFLLHLFDYFYCLLKMQMVLFMQIVLYVLPVCINLR